MDAARKSAANLHAKKVAVAKKLAEKEHQEHLKVLPSERARCNFCATLAGMTVEQFRYYVRPLKVRRAIARERASAKRKSSFALAAAQVLLGLECQLCLKKFWCP